ncbi:LysE family transporter [Eubacteriaceae bacterium ES2]|nr:LysE family transporter [Eubacteriaceae bacterium ES2]
MTFLLKGILIGLIFGIPLGSIGAMVTQRILNNGKKAGLITGLGSSLADIIYALIGAFGLAYISDFLLDYQDFINLLGGLILLLMSLLLFIQKEAKIADSGSPNPIKLLLPTFLIEITNPVMLLIFMFAFSLFDIAGPLNLLDGTLLAIGIFLGTFTWWLCLAVTIEKIAKNKIYQNKNKIFMLIYLLTGLFIVVRSIFILLIE